MLSAIADAEGFQFEETLTGFKWIASRSRELQTQKGYFPLFCYEEAIGFCCGDVVNDKDGLSAMGVMANLANEVYQSDVGNLANYLQHLYQKYGYFCSNNGYFFAKEPNIVNNILDQIRDGGNYCTKVGSYKLKSIRDLGYPGYDSTTTDRKPILPVSKSSPMITIRFENGCVAQFRGSGTEPKFKYYIELRGKPGIDEGDVKKSLEEMSNVILEELLKPDTNGLTR
jgi:phosphoglucomutase/phosphoglucomutase/phosphopentomutase